MKKIFETCFEDVKSKDYEAIRELEDAIINVGQQLDHDKLYRKMFDAITEYKLENYSDIMNKELIIDETFL